MGAIIIGLVMLSGFLAFGLSGGLATIAIIQIHDREAKTTIIKQAFAISLFIWAAIFLFPVDYGRSGSNYDIWASIWITKTVLFIFTPSILIAILTVMLYLNDPEKFEKKDPNIKYTPFKELLKQPQQDESRITRDKLPQPKTYPIGKLNMVYLSLLFIGFMLPTVSAALDIDAFGYFGIVLLLLCCISYPFALLGRGVINKLKSPEHKTNKS